MNQTPAPQSDPITCLTDRGVLYNQIRCERDRDGGFLIWSSSGITSRRIVGASMPPNTLEPNLPHILRGLDAWHIRYTAKDVPIGMIHGVPLIAITITTQPDPTPYCVGLRLPCAETIDAPWQSDLVSLSDQGLIEALVRSFVRQTIEARDRRRFHGLHLVTPDDLRAISRVDPGKYRTIADALLMHCMAYPPAPLLRQAIYWWPRPWAPSPVLLSNTPELYDRVVVSDRESAMLGDFMDTVQQIEGSKND